MTPDQPDIEPDDDTPTMGEIVEQMDVVHWFSRMLDVDGD